MKYKEVPWEIFIRNVISLISWEQQRCKLANSDTSADRPKYVPLTQSAADTKQIGLGCWELGILYVKASSKMYWSHF